MSRIKIQSLHVRLDFGLSEEVMIWKKEEKVP